MEKKNMPEHVTPLTQNVTPFPHSGLNTIPFDKFLRESTNTEHNRIMFAYDKAFSDVFLCVDIHSGITKKYRKIAQRNEYIKKYIVDKSR